MNPDSINKMVLVGNDCNLLVAALLLSQNLQQLGVEIICVELPLDEKSNPVENVGAELSPLFDIIGVSEFEVVAASRGIFSYGASCHAGSRNWFCPYGQYGLVNAENEFEQGLFRYLSLNSAAGLDNYSLAAVAAKNAKFAIAGAHKPELQTALEYGAILDTKLYRKYLKNLIARRGIEVVECAIINEVTRGDGDRITAISIDHDSILSADFWFDCSGDNVYLAAGVDNHRKLMPHLGLKYDRIVYFLAEERDLDKPFSTVTYTEFGLQKKVPLRDEVWYELHFDSSRFDDEKIKSSFECNIDVPVSYQFTEKLSLGFVPNPWQGNCLFVGHSGNNFGRSVICESSLVQEAIVRFLDVYPSPNSLDASAQGYNNGWAKVIQEAADYVALHTLLPGFEVNKDRADKQKLPDSLRKRVDLFKRLGRLPVSETDIIRDQQWYAMLFGLGVRPELHSIMIASLKDKEIEKTMCQLESMIKKIEKTMPASREFLDKFCP